MRDKESRELGGPETQMRSNNSISIMSAEAFVPLFCAPLFVWRYPSGGWHTFRIAVI